jgi:hypothetical protein
MTTPRVRLVFLAILLAVPLAVVAWDVSLYKLGGTEMTISWSMATAPRIVIFAVGFVAGGVIFGLAAHFWTTMPDPSSPPADPELAAALRAIVEYQPDPLGVDLYTQIAMNAISVARAALDRRRSASGEARP